MSALAAPVADKPSQKLFDAFRAVLDEALIAAIVHDYDLSNPTEYEAASEVLDRLSRDALAQDASGFNPSGIVGLDDGVPDGSSTNSSDQDRSDYHNETSSTGGSVSTDAGFIMPQLTSFNGKSDEDKKAQLRSIFSDLKEYDIDYALKKADGDFQTALDDLLNVQYLASTGQRAKGVDGFFKDAEPEQSPKKRKKKKGKGVRTDILDSSESHGSGQSAPETTTQRDEIAFLADRMDVPISEVMTVYQREWCSIGATATELLERYIELGIETRDAEGIQRAADLTKAYPGVPARFMPTIVQITSSIPEFSYDLAELLDKHFNKASSSPQALDISYKLAPLSLADIEGSSKDSPQALARQKAKASALSPTQHVMPGSSDYEEALRISQNYHQAKRNAADSAAQMHRRGASSPLYRQAAGYYADRAREQGRFALQATSAAAELLVDQQSTSRTIDLHGVHVQDGVRIARERAQRWWVGLGDAKASKARQDSLTIVTGLGRHSAGGVSQLRQAVAAALLQDGWKMQVETGRFVLTGRR